jgi:hydrogenase/urease accessory protein HupE
VLFTLCAPAQAHNLALYVLSLRQVSDEQFVVRWERTPNLPALALGNGPAADLLLRPLFPEHCTFEAPRLSCPGGLHGRLGFAGLGALSASALVHVRWLHAPETSYSFHAAAPQLRLTPGEQKLDRRRVAQNFLWLGMEHIALGWDHLLFVLGLLWLVPSRRALIKTITGFTLAHSLTLSAATLGYFRIAVPATEAVIALSIVFVAAEAVKRGDGQPSLSRRAPWLVAFGFGLLHGFGFASALGEVALPAAQLPIALFCFNLGVELGQLIFVALALGVAKLFERFAASRVARLTALLQYAAGSLAMYWFAERVADFARTP